MNNATHHPTNQLLALLSPREHAAIAGQCESIPLIPGAEIMGAGEIATHVHFPLEGYISLITAQPNAPRVEVGMVGREGFVGSQLLLRVPRASWVALVQGEGTALRMETAAFHSALEGPGQLQSVLMRYIATVMTQFAIAAPCLRFHEIPQRLARWLLMTHDRAGKPSFPATHEYLSYMLGVRRAGVTEAAGDLQRTGAIAYERGVVTVLDRAMLEHASCACYAADCVSYSEAMQPA